MCVVLGGGGEGGGGDWWGRGKGDICVFVDKQILVGH